MALKDYKPGETGKFKTPFGSFRLRKWAITAFSGLAVVYGCAWVWNNQIKHALPSRLGQSAEIEFTRKEMAEHALMAPDWSFKSPDQQFYGEGYSDAVCMEWKGRANKVQKCIAHPDEAGESPMGPMPVRGAGMLLATQQPPTYCGWYEDQFEHGGEYYWEVCGAEGEWVRYCFLFWDDCMGYRDRHTPSDTWAPFYWTYCQHR